MRVALLCNLLGTVLLFLSFQATSSNVTLVKTSDGSTYFCIGQRAIFIALASGGIGFISTCPTPQEAVGRPISVVNVEHPLFVTVGFAFTSLGFLLQVLALPSPRTIAQIRAELKTAKMQDKLRKEQDKLTRVHPDL